MAQKERYLPKIGTGEWIAAYALTETESGSDALAAKTRADLSDDGAHYVLNGTKQWITNAGFADLFVVFAQVGGDKFTAFLVERTYDGFQVGPEEHKHGIKGSSTCPLILTNVRVPVENVLGDVGKGHRIAFNILNVGRARLGIGSVGAAKYALGLATRYAKDRKQFGKALVEFGLIRGKLGEMAGRTFAGESMGYRTAGLIDKKYQSLDEVNPGPDDDDFQQATEEFTIESSILKVYGSEVLDYVADEALQIHGGYGYMTEYDIERVSRDARINRIFEGTNEINRMLLAGTVLKRGMKQRIPLMKSFGEVAAALSQGHVPDLETVGGRLIEDQWQVHRMKLATLFVMQQAVQRWMMTIEEQQAVLGALAEMLIELYAADSCIARALQYDATKSTAAFVDDCTTLSVESSRDTLFAQAKRVLCGSLEGDALAAALSRLALLDHWRSVCIFSVRDRIADVVIGAGGYPKL